ncbi:high affinity cGMP-specific 3',5'-cyclic phosphodiesterase 9A-like [Corticium candelabrum]|uniref:high affinity cGMP-specific 3',5'-cyclic phosphodiesterase 9A-like n=1 Tax=Corticium candelabrum TaxID=121492 RepID=UPI002E252D08|nr:high affinity cGMP-specific 3',5'-cyclic phosphodiesterase 9A-like [Corticium candelabrum]
MNSIKGASQPQPINVELPEMATLAVQQIDQRMGSGPSRKEIFVRIDKQEVQKVVFATDCPTADFKDLLASVAGVTWWSSITLQTASGDLVSVSPTVPSNEKRDAYLLKVQQEQGVRPGRVSNTDSVSSDEVKKMICDLENYVHADGIAKRSEVDQCKKELSEVRQQMSTGPVGPARCYNCSMVPDGDTGPMYTKYTLSDETAEHLKEPTFDIWHWVPNEMVSLLEYMYHELGIVTELNINPIVLRRFLQTVQANYRNNPFHNFRHCFCVTQMMYGMIHFCNLPDIMSVSDLGVLITACVCHDLDHPGFNNAYQKKARTELAVRYNNVSPLENHHCAVAFRILANPECNIFSNVPESKFDEIRSGILMLILGTDMDRHKELLDQFKDHLSSFSFTNEEDMNILKIILVKCCDISNEVRPMAVSDTWADCLLEECFQQGDREKQEGLDVSFISDRDKVSKPQAQVGFIGNVLIPLFEAVTKLFPQLEDPMIVPLRSALERYRLQAHPKNMDLTKEESNEK